MIEAECYQDLLRGNYILFKIIWCTKTHKFKVFFKEGKGDFVATYRSNNVLSNMSSCSFLVRGGPLDMGSFPSFSRRLILVSYKRSLIPIVIYLQCFLNNHLLSLSQTKCRQNRKTIWLQVWSRFLFKSCQEY